MQHPLHHYESLILCLRHTYVYFACFSLYIAIIPLNNAPQDWDSLMCQTVSVFKYCMQERWRSRLLHWTLCYNASAECVFYFVLKIPQSKPLHRFRCNTTKWTYFTIFPIVSASRSSNRTQSATQWDTVTHKLALSAQEIHCWPCWFGSCARYKNRVRQRWFRSSRHRRRCCVLARYWIRSFITQNNPKQDELINRRLCTRTKTDIGRSACMWFSRRVK